MRFTHKQSLLRSNSSNHTFFSLTSGRLKIRYQSCENSARSRFSQAVQQRTSNHDLRKEVRNG